ncbi:M15 family metallopeptidase [uncultured Ramlibacter sp.]|uniref:M15 family metallopeptidase n=1 Tax=uncultured Ramlibacter sp. TaxID=260755 RepID=UPI00262FB53C|nr:M15 family metallopeptidase [uncultured Ramlibacter sp.]
MALPTSSSLDRIPVVDCGDPLVDIRAEGGLLYGPPPECPATAPDYCWVRSQVYTRLLRVQEGLPAGLRLRLYEGLRSLAVQQQLFDEEQARVVQAHPGLTPQQVHERASLLIAPPRHWDGSPNLPPHSTGGAVDVELVGADGAVIDFGMQARDWVRVPAQFCETRHAALPAAAQANRLLLAQAMEGQGFVNYVREWWHYSYGDRYWAMRTGQPQAIFGPVAH